MKTRTTMSASMTGDNDRAIEINILIDKTCLFTHETFISFHFKNKANESFYNSTFLEKRNLLEQKLSKL